MKKIPLDIVALTNGVNESGNFAVVLAEQSGQRRLPIVIGNTEAQAIALAIEHMEPNRPLTHDLFKNTLESLGVTLKEVIIANFIDGIFYSNLVCELNGEIIEIDARTSDALALAVRIGCPIYAYEFIMDSAGVIMHEFDAQQEDTPRPRKRRKRKRKLVDYSLDDLNSMLDKVLADENYERAAEIRDELQRREEVAD